MLTLFHDPGSPASAVAVARLRRLSEDGVDVAFEGFDPIGVDVPLPPGLDVLAQLDALAGEARAEGIVLRRPPVLPPTGLAHVLLAHAETTPQRHEVRAATYRALWEDGADLADPDVLVGIAASAGLAEDVVAALLADRLALAARRRAMTGFRRDGVGGVPVLLASRTLVPGLLDEPSLRALAAGV